MKATDIVLMAALMTVAGVSEAEAKHLFQRHQDSIVRHLRGKTEKRVRGKAYRWDSQTKGITGKRKYKAIVARLPRTDRVKYITTCEATERPKYKGTWNIDCQADMDWDGFADKYWHGVVSTNNLPTNRLKRRQRPFHRDPAKKRMSGWKKINQNTYYGSPRQKRRKVQDNPKAWAPARRHYTVSYDVIHRR